MKIQSEHELIRWIKNPMSDVWIFILILIFANLVASRSFLRFDLTAPKSYSISAASKNAVRTIEEPLSIKVFFSDNLPSPYSEVYQYVKDLLSEYGRVANRNFNYELFDMSKPENESLARSYGLNQVQIREIKDHEVGYKNVFMGLVLTYADQIETVDGLSSSDGVEYKITTTINKVISSTNALAGLSDPVRVTLYRSRRLEDFGINGFDEIDGRVQSAVNAANKRFHNALTYNVVDPASSEVSDIASHYGIQKVSWNEKNGSVSCGALGLVVECGEKFRIVPLEMVNVIFGYAISGLDELDDTLVKSVQALAAKTSTVAYLTNHGELALNDSQNGAGSFASLMADRYSFEELDLSQKDIPAGVQSLVINGPKTALSDSELYKIDQFLMRGGNVMLFLDPFNEVMPEGEMAYYAQPQYVPNKTGMEKLLSAYGVSMDEAYVFDGQCYHQNTPQYGRVNFYYAPLLQKKQLDKNSDISKNLGYVIFLQSGAVDVSQIPSGESVTVLAKSSADSWLVKDNIMMNPLSISKPEDSSQNQSYNLSVLVEGNFTSAFENPPDGVSGDASSSMTTVSHLSKSVQKGKLFVAATSYITGPQMLQENSTVPIALFLQNAVDYMNGNGELCEMRTKGLSLNALKETRGAMVTFAKYMNSVGLAVIVALIGLFVAVSRSKHRMRIRLCYDADDAREAKDED
ncbi:MAG: Gldg family protein [Treponema sp.]|nr:Gldg family protein [Treponema sp.]